MFPIRSPKTVENKNHMYLHSPTIALGSFLFALVFSASTLFAAQESLSLQDYLKSIFSTNDALKTQMLFTQKAQSSYEAANSPYTLGVQLVPQFSDSTSTQEGTTTKSRVNTLKAIVNQSFPFGMSLNLTAQQTKDSGSDNEQLPEGSTFSAKIEQDLWQNRWGQLTDYQQTLSTFQLESQKSNFRRQKLKLCLQGVNQFIEAYTLQQKRAVMENIFDASLQLIRLTRRGHKRRLISKLDLLSAETDHLRLKIQKEKLLSAFKNQFTAMSIEAEKEIPQKMLSPQKPLEEQVLPAKESFYLANSEIAALRAKSLESETQLQISREKRRSQVKVFLEGGQKKSHTLNSSLQTVSENESFFNIGLTMDWPLLNEGADASVTHALKDAGVAKHRLNQMIKEIQSSHIRDLEALSLLKKQLELNQKTIRVYEEQTSIAQKRMLAGRLEFEEYLRFRDRLLNERLNYWDLKNKIWNQKIQLVTRADQIPTVCGGVL